MLLDRLPPGARIAVIRLRSLGDCVLTTPALSLLKAHRPDFRIAIVVENRFAPVYEGNPDVEVTLPPTVAALRAWRPDATINLHGGTRSMTLTVASGARYRAGFAHHRFAFLYTHKIPRAQEILRVERKVHTAEHVASAIFFLGVPPVEVPRARMASVKGHVLLGGTAPKNCEKLGSRDYALIHPFASAPEKTWPVERFLAVADHIDSHLGLEPIFIPGPGEPVHLFGRYRVIQNAPIQALKGLMSRARLFIGNDSGPAHFAAAYGVACVVVFGPTDPAVWFPWRTEGRALQMPGGIREVSIAQVIEAVEAVKPRVNA
jgi:heptosyltransferase-3